MTQPPVQPPVQNVQPLTYQGAVRGGWEQVRAVAAAQRLLLWAVLVSLILIAPQFLVAPLEPSIGKDLGFLMIVGLLLGAAVFRCIALFKLCMAMGMSVGMCVLWLVLGFVPCVGLIILLVINQQATSMLQRAGLKVGLMGATCPDYPPAGWRG